MFVQGTAKEINARLHDLKKGRSMLDFVNDSAKRLQKDLGPKDRDRLDQYFTSVRDLETRLHESEEWEKKTQAGGQGSRAQGRRDEPAARLPAS